jgi:hypothetical protein
MGSVIQIDESLVAFLPPKARLKIQRLIDLAIDCESSFMALIQRQERIRSDLGGLRAQQERAIARSKEATDSKEAAAAASAEYDPAIKELEGELARLEGDRKKREQRRFDSAQLVAQLRQFISDAVNRRQPLAMGGMPVRPELQANETPPQGIRRIRAHIDKTRQDLANLRKSTLPASELKIKAREFVHQLSLAGTPSLHVQGAAFRVDWPVGAQQQMGTLGPGAAAVMAWLMPEVMIDKLDDIIDKTLAKGGSNKGVSSIDRPKREYELQADLVDLERLEESVITRFEGDFPELLRRPDADPLSVLEMRFGLASKAKAS